MSDNEVVKKSFLEHLRKAGYTDEHLEVYGEYLDFFLARLGKARIMDLPPDAVYRAAMDPVAELDGEDIVEAYLTLIELFMEFWGERWESMHPEMPAVASGNEEPPGE